MRIEPRWEFADVRHAAIGFGRELEQRDDGVTTAWWKEERGERIFVDFNQNTRDRTIASAYSLRPLPGAPVSTPVTWDELAGLTDPRGLNLFTVPDRLADGDPWAASTTTAHSLEPLLALWEELPGRRAQLPARLPQDARASRRGCSRPRRSSRTGTPTATLVTTERPRVLHLNGAPGVGKSTLARRWVEEHPGTLLLDPDVLRTWVGGWREDFVATGALVRPLALAMIAAYVERGHDVVLAQLLANPDELARFAQAATGAGGRFVEVVLTAGEAALEARFAARPVDTPELEAVHRLVGEAGPGHLTRYRDLLLARPSATFLDTEGQCADASYAALVRLVAHAG